MDVREFVGGPLNNHKFYLKCIALPNCSEFFEFYDSDFRQSYKIVGEFDRYVCVRKFVIAVESLNNVFDYFYHEFHQGIEGLIADKKIKIEDDKFKEMALKLIDLSGMNEVVDIANAYKHSERRSKKYRINYAKNIIERRRFMFDFEEWKFNYLDGGFYLPKESQVAALRESFAFWSDYCSDRASVSREDLELLLG